MHEISVQIQADKSIQDIEEKLLDYLVLIVAECPEFLESKTDEESQDKSGTGREDDAQTEEAVEKIEEDQVAPAREAAGDDEFYDRLPPFAETI
jgi:hypothetical protein